MHVSPGNCAVAIFPSIQVPHWVDSNEFADTGIRTRWHIRCVLLVRFWPHAWASASVCQCEVRLLHNLRIIHGFLHEEVLAPRTILPLALAFRSLPPPALVVGVVSLELLQEPFHTGLAGNLKIAKVAHKNFVAGLNIRSSRCLWELGQAVLEKARQENSGNIRLHSPREACIYAFSFDLFPCTHEQRCIQVFCGLVLPHVLLPVRSRRNRSSASPSIVNNFITEYA